MKINGRGKVQSSQKTMNSRYLNNLLKSRLFAADLLKFLEHRFITKYTERRIKKVENLVEKLRKKFFLPEGEQIQELCTYLEKDSKCKLPWSNYELRLAKKSVIELAQDAQKGCGL